MSMRTSMTKSSRKMKTSMTKSSRKSRTRCRHHTHAHVLKTTTYQLTSLSAAARVRAAPSAASTRSTTRTLMKRIAGCLALISMTRLHPHAPILACQSGKMATETVTPGPTSNSTWVSPLQASQPLLPVETSRRSTTSARTQQATSLTITTTTTTILMMMMMTTAMMRMTGPKAATSALRMSRKLLRTRTLKWVRSSCTATEKTIRTTNKSLSSMIQRMAATSNFSQRTKTCRTSWVIAVTTLTMATMMRMMTNLSPHRKPLCRHLQPRRHISASCRRASMERATARRPSRLKVPIWTCRRFLRLDRHLPPTVLDRRHLYGHGRACLAAVPWGSIRFCARRLPSKPRMVARAPTALILRKINSAIRSTKRSIAATSCLFIY
eukprot:m.77021 g.77021  ORF g.77021 m.77021 type:complete len:381 (+) comp8127_c1_seq1:1294-2436(+)